MRCPVCHGNREVTLSAIDVGEPAPDEIEPCERCAGTGSEPPDLWQPEPEDPMAPVKELTRPQMLWMFRKLDDVRRERALAGAQSRREPSERGREEYRSWQAN